jgi:hypothetical protein
VVPAVLRRTTHQVGYQVTSIKLYSEYMDVVISLGVKLWSTLKGHYIPVAADCHPNYFHCFLTTEKYIAVDSNGCFY